MVGGRFNGRERSEAPLVVLGGGAGVWMAQADKGSGQVRWDSGSVVGGPKRCEGDDERRIHGQVYVLEEVGAVLW